MNLAAKVLCGALAAAAFFLACRTVPVYLEEEHVQAAAGSLANKVIVVDGPDGGFAGEGSQAARKLMRWLAGAGAMVRLSGDVVPSLAYPGAPARRMAGLAAQAAHGADLMVSVGRAADGCWRLTYPAGEGELARDIAREISLAEPAGRPALVSVFPVPGSVPWVQVATPPLDSRGEDNLAWAVYAGVVRYFAARTPTVDPAVLKTMEDDVPVTVDTP